MRKSKPRQGDRLRPLSIEGLSVEDALKGAMEVPVPEQPKKKRKAGKRKKKAP